jgi:hypothetical protein
MEKKYMMATSRSSGSCGVIINEVRVWTWMSARVSTLNMLGVVS